MVDTQTLMISLLIIEALFAALMLIIAKIQDNYPGFLIWSISLVVLTISSVFLSFRGFIPDIISILLGNTLFLTGLVLMAESLHRFYTNMPLNRMYYLIIVPFVILIGYYTLIEDTISIRSCILTFSSAIILSLSIHIVYRNAAQERIPSILLMASLTGFVAVMVIRGVLWFLRPLGRDFFESSPLNIGLYIAAIIALIIITIMYLLLHFHRLNTELRRSNEKTKSLLADLDSQNRELEHLAWRLQTLNEELEQKVKERTKNVENLLLQKDHFINQIAHDLRTPLTSLVALVPLIRKKIRDEETTKLVDILDQSIKHLRNWTDQIIMMAKINRQNSITDYEEFSLAGLVAYALNKNAVLIADKKITVSLNIPEDLTVCVSTVLGETIFSNIISNAVKFNSTMGHIIITGSQDNKNVRITVTDTGIGMNRETIERIWDELYVADESRSDPESKGLGLAMVRKIIELHEGTISAMSPGLSQGSTIRVTLPRFCPDFYNIPDTGTKKRNEPDIT
ncbi:MAG: HAMP domain-containing histidine kinase [Methanospirillaceae archaeon]|nr:HAMP domain-containing histidine kinase [Methanospirillaceae archaeon]